MNEWISDVGIELLWQLKMTKEYPGEGAIGKAEVRLENCDNFLLSRKIGITEDWHIAAQVKIFGSFPRTVTFPTFIFCSTVGALVVKRGSTHHPLQSSHFLLSSSTAQSNCVLTFPDIIYLHTCYCLSSFNCTHCLNSVNRDNTLQQKNFMLRRGGGLHFNGQYPWDVAFL